MRTTRKTAPPAAPAAMGMMDGAEDAEEDAVDSSLHLRSVEPRHEGTVMREGGGIGGRVWSSWWY